MKITFYTIITCGILSAATFVLAQTQTPATQPVEQRVLPEVRFDGVGFDDVMAFFRDVAPGFSPYIVRDSNVASNTPQLTLHAKDITIDQFLVFLEQAYGVKTTKVEGPVNPIWVIKIPHTVGNFKSDRRLLRPYSLRDAIVPLITGRNGNTTDIEKQALQDVLMLIQTALKEAHADQDVSIKVHEPTRTLLVYGALQAHDVVDQVLQTLRPSTDDIRAKSEEELRKLRAKFDEQAAVMQDLTDSNIRLKQQIFLEANKMGTATTSPSRPKE
jgi:hypothetical protein